MAFTINASGDQEHFILGKAKNVSIHINNTDLTEKIQKNEDSSKLTDLRGQSDIVDISDEAYAMNASAQADKTDSKDEDKGNFYAGNMNVLQEKKENAPADPTDVDDIQKQIKEVQQKIREAEQKVKEYTQEPGLGAEDQASPGAETSQVETAKQQLAQYQSLLSQLQMQLMQVTSQAGSK